MTIKELEDWAWLNRDGYPAAISQAIIDLIADNRAMVETLALIASNSEDYHPDDLATHTLANLNCKEQL